MSKAKKLLQIPLLNLKIQAHHYDRLAIVYIRRSTLQQVERHSESTKLQYNLVNKVYELGWAKEKLIVIDEDLGRSGATVAGRSGFQRLVAEVGLNHVGIILGIEISRLARSCKDWYQLLEVCAIFRTLIADADGIYDPTLYNDRLLLGLKGTMSEAELHIIKQRMLQGRKAKASRGELSIPAPMGYAKLQSGQIVKDPDEQAQAIIGMVFDLFNKFSTINAVLKYLVEHKIHMPYREVSGMQKGELTWRRPNRNTLGNLFHNPIYAGAYAYGRKPRTLEQKLTVQFANHTVRSTFNCEVLIKNMIPAYISWEQYELNQRQLLANSVHGIGAVRQGDALLSGLVFCGRCGLKMATYYTNNRNKSRYICDQMYNSYGENICQSLVGRQLDELISKQALEALKPSALEVSLQVATELEQEHNNLQKHWWKKLERARYEVERAYRQYNSSEPENRLVTRELEKKWEELLSEEEELKQEYEKFLSVQSKVLSAAERESIYKLASDVPALWASPTTTIEERKEILRLLISRIIVKIEGTSEKVFIEIHWSGGYKTSASFIRPVGKLEQLSYYKELMALVTNLKEQGMTARNITDAINQRGWRPPKLAKIFTIDLVHRLIVRCGKNVLRKSFVQEVDRGPNELTFYELSQKINIPESTLYCWMRKGELKVRRVAPSPRYSMWLITADTQEMKRLIALRGKPRQWIYRSRIKKVY